MAKQPATRRAYSYIRFSSAEQEKGDSVRRQIALRNQVLAQHPEWILDQTPLQDFGVSAWTGTNVDVGALGVFILACEAGKIPRGSVLIIEQWDRLSRRPAVDTMALFSRITQCGIDICTAEDGMIHNRESMKDIGKLLTSIIKMQVANEESTKKSERVKEAWGKKRNQAQVLTSRGPGWVRWNGTRFELIPPRAKVVKEIFQMTVAGKGRLAICNVLNKRKEPTWGEGNVGGWWPCYISKILHNHAVIGRFQPCKTARNERGKTIRIPDGDIRERYFPRVIDDRLWQRVQEHIAGAKKCHGAMAGAGRPGGFPVRNLFSGLLYDGYHPGSRMVLAGSSDYLMSDWSRLSPGSKRVAWKIPALESLVLGYLRGLEPERLIQREVTASEEEMRLATVQTNLDTLNRRVEQLMDTLETCDPPEREMILRRLSERTQAKKELERELRKLKAAQATAKAATTSLGEAREAMRKLLASGDGDARLRLRAEARRIVKRIDVFPYGASDKELKCEVVNSPGGPCFRITFVNGLVRWVFCDDRESSSQRPVLLDTNLPNEEAQKIFDDDAGGPEGF